MTDYMTPKQLRAHRAEFDAAFTGPTNPAEFHRQHAIVTKPGDPGGYRGEYNCGDCCSMTHCETHHKDEGLYPFDIDDASLDRSVTRLLKRDGF